MTVSLSPSGRDDVPTFDRLWERERGRKGLAFDCAALDTRRRDQRLRLQRSPMNRLRRTDFRNQAFGRTPVFRRITAKTERAKRTLHRERLHVALRSDHPRRGEGLARTAGHRRAERRDAFRADHRGEPGDLCVAQPPRPLAAVLYRDDRSRDAPRLSPTVAGAAGELRAVARDRDPARCESGPRRFDGLCPAAGRPRAAGPAAGDRSLRTVLSARTPEPRRLLSRRLRRPGRDADDSANGAVPDRRPRALWTLGERSRRRLLRDRRGAEPGVAWRRPPDSIR